MKPSADIASRSPRALTAALGALVGAFAFLFACQKIYDPDTWWHLATGRWVVQHGLVPAHDIFSFATADAPWVAYSWLPATGMYLVHGAGGAPALVLVKALLVAAAFVLAFAFAVRAHVHPWLAAVALCLAVPVARFQFRERPQILMFALVALSFWLLARPGAERRRSTWIALALAQVLWANVHGSFFLGIALTGALFTERLLGVAVARVRRAPATAGSLPLAGGLLAVVVVASFATPYGAGLVAQTLRDMTALSVSRTFVNEEFQALSPARYPGFVAFAVATALSFAVAGRRSRPYTVAVFAGLALLAFGSVRFAAIAAFVFAFVLALNLQPALDRLRDLLSARGTALPSPRLVSGLLVGALGLFGALALSASFGPGREAQFGLGVNESRFPGPAVQYLARAGFEGNLFNSWIHGGYLLWHLPGAKDLVDGRALPAHTALLQQLSSMNRPALDRWVEAHDVKGALLTRDDGFLPLFADSPRFTRAFFDDRAVVYLRKDVAAGGPAASGGYRFIRPELYDPSYLIPFAGGPQRAEAEAELRKAVADSPDSFTPRFLLGFFLEAQGRGEALDQYLTAARLNPGLAFAHYDLGKRAGAVAIATGQAAKVEPFLRKALTFKRDDPALEALLGTTLYLQKKLPKAEALLRHALATSPDLPLALTNLGYLLTDTARAREAVPLFERARSLAPADENAAYGLAFALHSSGDRAAAAAAWGEFLRAFPSSAWAPRARQLLGQLGAPR